MAKSKYEFWILWPNGTKSRLPILPGVLNISNGSQNESVSISGLGEVTIIQDPAAKIFSFTSFFSSTDSPLLEYANPSPPWAFIERFEMFKSHDKPIRFLVTGTPINYAVSIEDFNYREGEKDIGDYDYDIILKEYKFIEVRKIEREKPKPKPARPDSKAKSGSYTVKKGDTLIAIARKHYGDSSRWRDIWEANKAEIIKRDKRNLKQPGHWIHIQANLRLPT